MSGYWLSDGASDRHAFRVFQADLTHRLDIALL
jgi:hypothetical protein